MTRVLAALALASGLLAAQPAFEVASIRPSPDGGGDLPKLKLEAVQDSLQGRHPPGWMPMDGARVTLHRQTLTALIATAYRVRVDQVSGPAFLADERFDVEATLPAGAAPEEANEMLQALLAERFGLAVHREEKPGSGYALTVAKGGAKLPPAGPAEAPPQTKEQIIRQKMAAETGAGRGAFATRLLLRAATPADLAARLTAFLHRPVEDRTGLDGRYDIALDVVQSEGDLPDYAVSQALAPLGLRLETHKLPEVKLVVDRISKDPTPNE
jgi:uncharacterized protein (TIGR03435 family)